MIWDEEPLYIRRTYLYLMAYTVVYDKSFLLFWGVFLGAALFAGGLLFLAAMLVLMLLLLTHEYAHVRACEEIGCKVNSVTFSALGGATDCDVWHAHDAVSVLKAGINDTTCFMISFGEIYIIFDLLNGANQWLSLAKTLFIGAAILTITNYAVPNVCDGALAKKFEEVQDEVWNEGRWLAEPFR
jgi:hypothetical protein